MTGSESFRFSSACRFLRSTAVLYMLLRGYRTRHLSLVSFRDLVASYGPTDEARGNALDIDVQMRLDDRLNLIFCAPLAPTCNLGPRRGSSFSRS